MRSIISRLQSSIQSRCWRLPVPDSGGSCTLCDHRLPVLTTLVDGSLPELQHSGFLRWTCRLLLLHL